MELNQSVLTEIHNHTIDILNRKGFRFNCPEAIKIFQKHGFKTSEEIVYFTGDQVEKALSLVPSEVTVLARDPRYNLKLELDTVAFGLGRGAVFMLDEGDCRKATMSDMINITKLAQQLPEVRHWQHLIYLNDIPAEYASMCANQIMIKYQTKPDNITGLEEFKQVLLAFGGITFDKAKEMSQKRISYGLGSVNPLSPLTLTEPECRTLLAYAEHGLATQITPMPLAGSTAPCTLMGVVIQQNCEVLAPLVLFQLINPGCPVLYGNMGSGSDMRSMGGSFGSPESRLIEHIAGKVAKNYGLLTRGGIGITDSEYEGFQAGAEAMFQALNAMDCQSNLAIGMGIMGGYMGASLSKIILDAELVNYARSFFREIELSNDSTAVDLIMNTPFGGNFVTSEHTVKYCRKEHYIPKVFNRTYPDQWKQGTHEEFMLALKEKVANALEKYEPPEIDEAILKELNLSYRNHLPENLIFKHVYS
ncbi:MAG: trimethylamine methyltransferase family protein [Thermodesulfobacteriota bacterium]